jgi:uncharacterized SAM-binding protein YcdF (DUF218 family)
MILNKLLPVFLSPTALVAALIVVGLCFRRPWVAASGLAMFLFLSVPIVGERFFSWAQGHAQRLQPGDVTESAAVVLLGGTVVTAAGVDRDFLEWNDSVDRIFGAVDLIDAGRAPLLVISGGLPDESGRSQEGALVRALVERLGIPGEKLKVSGPALNTSGEVTEIRAVLGPKQNDIILVTSAIHMIRAKMQFERGGFRVQAYPVDIRVREDWGPVMRFAPSATVFSRVDLAVRELVGRAFYRSRYFLEDQGMIAFETSPAMPVGLDRIDDDKFP